MFEHLAKTPSKTVNNKKTEMTKTIEFLTCLVKHEFRLSYAALALAAREFGEDSSTQIPAQRGSSLVKTLPLSLQPSVCRKSGTYHPKVLKQFSDLPEGLINRPVITGAELGEAIKEWEDSLEG